MIDQGKQFLEKNAPRMTYGGSALTAGSSYAGQGAHSQFALSIQEAGVVVGIATAIIGLLMQAYFGWQKLKLQKAAYAQLGVKADDADSEKTKL